MNATITVVTENGTLAHFDPATKQIMSQPVAKAAKCHCEREPSKIWLCCLSPDSTCACACGASGDPAQFMADKCCGK